MIQTYTAQLDVECMSVCMEPDSHLSHNSTMVVHVFMSVEHNVIIMFTR